MMDWSECNHENVSLAPSLSSPVGVSIAVINGFAIIIGVIGNSLVIMTITTNKTFHTVYYALVAHLAAADLLVCLVDLPLISGIFVAQWAVLTTPFLCYLGNFCQNVLYPGSVMTLTAIALGRYVRITKSRPIYDRIFSASKVGVALAVLWSMIISCCVLIFLFFMENVPFICGTTICYVNVFKPVNRVIFCFINSTSLFVCLVTTPVCYILIFRAVRKSKRKVIPDETPNQPGTNSVTTSRPATFGDRRANRRTQLSPLEIRLTKMSATVFFLNLVMNTPYLILNTFGDIGNNFNAYMVALWFFAMSSMVNPIVYGVLNKNLRKEMKKLLSR